MPHAMLDDNRTSHFFSYFTVCNCGCSSPHFLVKRVIRLKITLTVVVLDVILAVVVLLEMM